MEHARTSIEDFATRQWRSAVVFIVILHAIWIERERASEAKVYQMVLTARLKEGVPDARPALGPCCLPPTCLGDQRLCVT